jgi:hypothetical protein
MREQGQWMDGWEDGGQPLATLIDKAGYWHNA